MCYLIVCWFTFKHKGLYLYTFTADETSPPEDEVSPEQTTEPTEGETTTEQQKTPEPGNRISNIVADWSMLHV